MNEHQRAAEDLLAQSCGRGPTEPVSLIDTDADAETTSAYIAGALNSDETAAFERRLADDDDLRQTWMAATASVPRRKQSRTPAAIWGLAAVVLVALGVFVAAQRKAAEPFDRVLSARLSAVDVAPYALADLTPGSLPVERNGLRLLAPRGVLLSTRPTLTWSHPKSGGAASVVVEDEQTGDVVLDTTSDSGELVWPADAPVLTSGRRYLWRCEAMGPMGSLRGSALFEVADDTLRAQFKQQVKTLGTGSVAELAAAHVALRRSLWTEALRRARSVRGLTGAQADHRDALATYARAKLAGARD